MAARSSGGGTDTIFDPFTPRLALAISTDGELLPNAPVTLTISGEAREVIDGGEVVVRLPTKAAMDHAGAGRPLYYPIGRTVPAEATWRLPAMGVGDTWERTVTVPAAAAGYYMVAVDADTEGPASDLGPYLFDDSYAQAWMFVSDTDGQLTDVFEDSLFAEGVLPVPGPSPRRRSFCPVRWPRACPIAGVPAFWWSTTTEESLSSSLASSLRWVPESGGNTLRRTAIRLMAERCPAPCPRTGS